jgi:hypothetical protein
MMGIITKDKLIDICVNLIKEINTSRNLLTSKKPFTRNLDNIVSIGDKNHYEKLPINSTNALIDFGGSVFNF